MISATVRDRLATLRTPARAARIAATLWIVWAVILWNVVFDHTIVVAGRAYLHAVGQAGLGRAPVPRMDAFMVPAAARGVRIATLAAAPVVAVGLFAARVAAQARDRFQGAL